MRADLFHSVITSPPYFGLRDYHGNQVVEWPAVSFRPQAGLAEIALPGCDPTCKHVWQKQSVYSTRTRNRKSSDAFTDAGPGNAERLRDARWQKHEWCAKCGGWRGPLGAEPTLEMYLGHLVLIAREIARVLRPDGTFWIVMGDSFNGSGGAGGDYGPGGRREGQPVYPGRSLRELQEGDLLMVPARVALALQADGWILRNDNTWIKKTLPEPRLGWRYQRPSCDCVKKQREAFIAKLMKEQGVRRDRIFEKAGTKFPPDPNCPRCHGNGYFGAHRFRPESWRHSRTHEDVFQFSPAMRYYCDPEALKAQFSIRRNPTTLLTPKQMNYSGKHYAVFPPSLVAPLMVASVPRRSCPECGRPWAPVMEYEIVWTAAREAQDQGHIPPAERRPSGQRGNRTSDLSRFKRVGRVVDYWPTCEHVVEKETAEGEAHSEAPKPVAGWVFDPFFGSGTVGLVARELGVRFVGADISRPYLDEQAKLRTGLGSPSKALDDLPLFNLPSQDDGKD